MRALSGVMALASVLVSVLASVPADAFVLYRADAKDPKSAPLRWFSLRATLVFDVGAPEEIEAVPARAAIEKSFRQWATLKCDGEATPFELTFGGTVSGREVGYLQDAGPSGNENLVIWVPAGWAHGKKVLALTSLTYDTKSGEIVDGDLELNDADYEFTLDAALDKTAIDLRNTVTHEAGHFLGLDHSLESEATMFNTAPPGEILKRDLLEDDVNGYCALYGPDAPLKVITGGTTAVPGTRTSNPACSLGTRPSASAWLLVVLFALALQARREPRVDRR